MGNDRVGMGYEDVRKRVMRITKGDSNPQARANLTKSLLNQARLRDGDGAVRELVREMRSR
jgi:hypothetical protein